MGRPCPIASKELALGKRIREHPPLSSIPPKRGEEEVRPAAAAVRVRPPCDRDPVPTPRRVCPSGSRGGCTPSFAQFPARPPPAWVHVPLRAAGTPRAHGRSGDGSDRGIHSDVRHG